MSLPPDAARRLRVPLQAAGLVLSPLQAEHAALLWPVLQAPALYRHLDHGPPLRLDTLQQSYARMAVGRSPDGQEGWGNWALQDETGAWMGVVQTTVLGDGSAWLAYVLGQAFQGRGHARAATAAVMNHLRSAFDSHRFMASVEVENQRSARLLQALGFLLQAGPLRQTHGLSASEQLYLLDDRPA